MLDRAEIDRKRLKNRFKSGIAVAISALTGAFFCVSAWPGWASPDTMDMLSQAIAGQIDDWHSPILTYVWSLTPASEWTTIFPFLTQQIVFWTAICIMTFLASRRFGLWAIALPIILLGLDYTWVMAWVWKDSTATALVAMSIALSFLALNARSIRWLFYWATASVVVLSLVFVARWYMFPTLIIGVLSVIYLVRARLKDLLADSSRGLDYPSRVSIGLLSVAILTMSLAGLFQAQIIKPSNSHSISSVQILDIGRVQCREGRYLGRAFSFLASPDTRLPSELISGSRPICDSFDSQNVGFFLWPLSGFSGVNYQDLSKSQRDELRENWISAWATGFPYLIADRVRLGISYLGSADNVTAPTSQITLTGADLQVLDFSRLPASLTKQVPVFRSLFQGAFLWAILLPLTVLAASFWRGRAKGWIILGAVFPAAWLVNFSLVAPGPDSRFAAPAVIWGLLFSLEIIVYLSSVKSNRVRKNIGLTAVIDKPSRTIGK